MVLAEDDVWTDYLNELAVRDLMETGGRSSVVPSVLVSRPGWMARGACRGSDVSFFAAEGESSEPAKRLCRHRCPVKDECLAFALADVSLDGVWGGTSERERREMRRSLRPSARGGS